jgi:hypothetical protein
MGEAPLVHCGGTCSDTFVYSAHVPWFIQHNPSKVSQSLPRLTSFHLHLG